MRQSEGSWGKTTCTLLGALLTAAAPVWGESAASLAREPVEKAAEEAAAGQEASPEPADTGEPASPTLLEALTGGDATLTLRLRYENVDDDGVASGKEAHAATLRTALGYRTLAYRGWDLYLQAENVSSLGNELFNSTRNGVTDRPVVAAPTGSELQQVYLRFRPADTTLIAGRQEINIGDHRFVGNVGWRQHHQSFDAFYAENASLERVRFLYAYLDRVHRVTRDEKAMASHALRGQEDGCHVLDWSD